MTAGSGFGATKLKFARYRWLTASLAASVLIAGCAGQPATRKDLACQKSIDQAYQALNYAKTQGFSGTVSYTKAGSLLAAAKVQQQVEKYDNCLINVDKARFY
ncbi:MAG: hypothetical protein OQK12_15890, partial [Motiliproteus sp.]|nr:hypothetical protein [Motiliproteus sp.]